MPELIWDAKYQDGKKAGPVRIELPFQTVETVNESTQDRQRGLELFSSGRETEWRNRLIWGDKKYVLPSLLAEFAGEVNLIYIDPPFDTGQDFSIDYTDNAMNLRCYYPDFVAVAADGTHWLLETKGQESPEVPFKDRAATEWCENATSLTGVAWRYRKVPQGAFEALRPAHWPIWPPWAETITTLARR